MRNLFTTLALFCSLQLFGAAPAVVGCDDEQSLYSEVSGLVNDQKALSEMDLKSMAQVTFSIDENNIIHVEQVVTKDYLFEFYIRQKLEGVAVHHCSDPTAQYKLVFNAKLV